VVDVTRSEIRILPDPSRVIARPFLPGAPAFGDGPSRVLGIVERILAIPASQVEETLSALGERSRGRHHDLEETWEINSSAALALAGIDEDQVAASVRDLIGAYFTQEYAIEAAAICNPSMVPAPGSDGGDFVMSMRAIGEGHISSVEFRTGRVSDDGTVTLDPPPATLSTGRRGSPTYAKEEFGTRLAESDPDPVMLGAILSRLGDHFSVDDLDKAISEIARESVSEAALAETRHLIHWVATSNYELDFGAGELAQRVLVPAGPADSHGMEDVRWIRFHEDGEPVTYYGTYTAFDGTHILPQLIETEDFTSFRVSTMSGKGARNKGMALFPRRIDGEFVALGRADRENIHVLRSPRVRHWGEHEVVYRPVAPWEIIQVGNCGPPLETPAGWLVLTHGVGPMRRYAIGAALLDLDRPERLLARSTEPLLEPAPDERDGYVPNVVYSCGGMIFDGRIVLPYGFSDRAIGIATMDMEEVIASLRPV
jgi:predicted GH43/DUF377 family glycosyl hydrolase